MRYGLDDERRDRAGRGWSFVLVSVLSKTQVRKAGKVLRRLAVGELVDPAEAERAFDVLMQYRRDHAEALTKATMGLRSRVRTAGFAVVVSQRLKERATIMHKLVRYPRMQLHTMQDVAGCRAVLPDVDAVRAVQRRWTTGRYAGRVQRVDDYIVEPKASGYRGVHVIVVYDGRTVEVQLRSQAQHDWAYTVEQLGGQLGHALKMGEGPVELLGLLVVLADINEMESQGLTVPDSMMDRWTAARTAAAPFLKEA